MEWSEDRQCQWDQRPQHSTEEQVGVLKSPERVCMWLTVDIRCLSGLQLLLLRHFSCVWLCATLWTAAHQASISLEFSRQEYWSGLLCPPPGDLPNSGIESGSPASQVDSLPVSHQGSQESSRKTSISALLTMPKPLTVWITINCGKFWKRWEYQTTWSASWEICMQVRKQQLELDMEQQTGSK